MLRDLCRRMSGISPPEKRCTGEISERGREAAGFLSNASRFVLGG